MSKSRQPIELIEAKGKKHLSKAEIEIRKKSELKVDLKDINIPNYLTAKEKKEFQEIARKLLEIGIMTELDEDILATNIIARSHYVKYTKLLNKAIKESEVSEMEKLTAMQDKAFKQFRASANDLGLTISSRCKLIMPDPKEPPKKNKFVDKFGG